MTAIALPMRPAQGSGRSFRTFFFISLMICFSIAAGILIKTHANKHSLADTVRNCPSDRLGAILSNPTTGRKVKLCEFQPRQWGRFVFEQTETGAEEEVTSFADSARPTRNLLGRVVRNLLNQGYKGVEWIRPDVADEVIQILAETQ